MVPDQKAIVVPLSPWKHSSPGTWRTHGQRTRTPGESQGSSQADSVTLFLGASCLFLPPAEVRTGTSLMFLWPRLTGLCNQQVPVTGEKVKPGAAVRLKTRTGHVSLFFMSLIFMILVLIQNNLINDRW